MSILGRVCSEGNGRRRHGEGGTGGVGGGVGGGGWGGGGGVGRRWFLICNAQLINHELPNRAEGRERREGV